MNGATVHDVVRAKPTTAITPKPPVLARKMERRRDPGTPAVAQKAAASTDAEWTPVVLHGSPAQMVTNFVSQAPLSARAALIVSTGTHLIVFFGRQRRGTFQLDKGAAQLPAGIFTPYEHNKVQQLWQHRGDNSRDWFPATVPKGEPTNIELVVASERDKYHALVKDKETFWLRAESTGEGAGGAGEGGAEKATAEGAGEGGGGESAPVIPDWARNQFNSIRDRVRSEKRRITAMAGKDIGERDEKAIERLLALAAVPSNVLLGSDGKKMPLLLVEVPGRQGALALTEGQGSGLLWERVQAVTRLLNAGLKPSRDASPQDLLLGLPSEDTPDPDTVAPNQRAYPSRIENLGPAVGIAYSVHRFQMKLDWTFEGQTFPEFGPRAYRWDVFRLRTAAGALGKPDDKRRVGRGQAAKARLKEGFYEIGEDVWASGGELVTGETSVGELVTDAAVRSVGTLVHSFVDLASTPTDERGVQWEDAGTYVVRCVSSRPPLSREDAPENPFVRAPSVALYPIRVVSAEDMAAQLTAPAEVSSAETELGQLTQQLDKSSEQDRGAIQEDIKAKRAEIDRLKAADEASTTEHLDDLDAETSKQIALTQMVADLRNTGKDAKEWEPLVTPNTPALLRPPTFTADQLYGLVVSLHVQLTLAGREPATVIEELRRVREQTRKQRTALLDVAGDMKADRQFRLHMSFVPRLEGRALPLMMVLGEDSESTEDHPTWLLFDLSTPGHHDRYHGSSSASAPKGHAEAIRRAIDDFVRDVPYGVGTVGVRLPESLKAFVGKDIDIGVPATIEATPGKSARARQRLESLATAASIAALLVSGPAGIALGIVGGIAGGVVAAQRIYRRYEGGYLEMDLATAMDITAIVGAVAAPVGAWAGSVRAGTASLGTTYKWLTIAGRVERGVKVFGYLQLGGQVFVIPLQLAEEMEAIEKDLYLTPGQRSARRAMAFLNAINQGLQTLGTVHQMLSEHVQFADAPPPDLAAIRAAEMAAGTGETPPRPGEAMPPGEVPARPGGEVSTGRTETPAGVTEAPAPSGEPPARPTLKPGEETVEPGGRTTAGTGAGEPRPPRGEPAADANPVARARAVELIEQRLGRSRPRQPGGRAARLTEKDLAARPKSADEAVALYDRAVAGSGGHEVGLFYNPNTGEFAVSIGTEFSVSPPPDGDGWQAIVHLHPNPENVIVRRMPAPADVMGAVRAAMRSGTHTEFVQFERPDGSTGVSRVRVTTDPLRIVVELPAEPPSRGYAGEPARTIDVATHEAYARDYGAETIHLDPTSPLYRWIIRDLDAYYAARRKGQAHDAGEGRTAAGTSLPAREGPAAAPGPAEPTAPRAFRAELESRRPDIHARFLEADVALMQGDGDGIDLSGGFDAAMSALEGHGMGPEGRAAVERMLARGKGQDELSAGRLRRVVTAMQHVVEVLAQSPELVKPEGPGGQAQYRTQVRDLADQVNTAYQNSTTLDGVRLSSPDSPELADAIRRMNRAVDDESSSGTRDPVARLFEVMALRDQVADTGEILRSYGPRFTATETESPTRTAPGDTLVRGVPERTFTVEASGVVGEPLARDLPGLGLEEYMLAPRALAELPTRTRGLGRRLAELLRGWHRAHLVGPGFGSELFTGMMLAPEHVNLRVQNEGVEHFIRTAAANKNVAEVSVRAYAEGRRLEVPLKKGTEYIDVLTRVEYEITITLKGFPGQERSATHRVTIEIGPPPEGAVKVDSTIPATAPGGDVLATFPRITPVGAVEQ